MVCSTTRPQTQSIQQAVINPAPAANNGRRPQHWPLQRSERRNAALSTLTMMPGWLRKDGGQSLQRTDSLMTHATFDWLPCAVYPGSKLSPLPVTATCAADCTVEPSFCPQSFRAHTQKHRADRALHHGPATNQRLGGFEGGCTHSGSLNEQDVRQRWHAAQRGRQTE